MTEENHEKTPVRLIGTGTRTRDLPNAGLVRYHGAISLGSYCFVSWEYMPLRKGLRTIKHTLFIFEFILLEQKYESWTLKIGTLEIVSNCILIFQSKKYHKLLWKPIA